MRSPPGSTNTTPTEGIPPSACSARSTTKKHAHHHAPPGRTLRNAVTGALHEPRGRSLALHRARLRARPSGLKGRYRDRYATGLRPALDPGASTAPDRAAVTGRRTALPAQRAALDPNQDQIPTTKSVRSQGIASDRSYPYLHAVGVAADRPIEGDAAHRSRPIRSGLLRDRGVRGRGGGQEPDRPRGNRPRLPRMDVKSGGWLPRTRRGLFRWVP